MVQGACLVEVGDDVVDIGEIALQPAVVVQRDRLAGDDRAGEAVIGHVRPAPGPVHREKPQAGLADAEQVGIGVAHQLVGQLGRRIQRQRRVHPIGFAERQHLVGAVHRGAAGIDQVAQRRQPPSSLQHHQVPHHVRVNISVRIDQGVPDPGLRRQVHDDGDVRMRGSQRLHRRAVRDIDPVKSEAGLRFQPVQPRLLQPHVVIGVEVIDPDHLRALRQQRLGHVIADEPRRAGEQDLHVIGRATRRSSSNSNTA